MTEWMWRKAELAAVVGVMTWLWIWANVAPGEKEPARRRGGVKPRPASTES